MSARVFVGDGVRFRPAGAGPVLTDVAVAALPFLGELGVLVGDPERDADAETRLSLPLSSGLEPSGGKAELSLGLTANCANAFLVASSSSSSSDSLSQL